MHGEWVDIMKVTMGKRGKVLKVYPDGDLRVSVGTMTFTFNPACCHVIRPDVNTGACVYVYPAIKCSRLFMIVCYSAPSVVVQIT